MSLLIVASETSSPLCTDTSIPTDGQPQWWWCECGHRTRFPRGYSNPRHIHRDAVRRDVPMAPDGPFPFWAGRWAEVDVCGACNSPLHPAWWKDPPFCELHVSGGCDPWREDERVGAIVELVEVVGPSHHADECDESYDHAYTGEWFAQFCHPDALPDGWHTPTGKVTRIDPIPCDRPTSYHDAVSDVTVSDESPAWWTAPEDIAAKLAEVSA